MCKFCQELVKCPIGEKRRVIVEKPKNRETVDYYGHKLRHGDIIMFVDKYKDHTDAGIYQDCYTEDSVQYGGGFDIKCCPYCGQRLVVEE